MAAPGLTTRDKEVLAVAIEFCDRRQMAIILNMGFVTLDKQLAKLCKKLSLPSRFVKFSSVKLGDPFMYKGMRYKRVDRSTDRYGGYNAEDASGQRTLVLYHTIVEIEQK